MPSIATFLLFLLMLIKLVFVIPMAYELHGFEWGLVNLLICLVGYGALIFLEETTVRRQG